MIDSHLGLRSTLIGYQYSEIIRAIFSVFCCGGDCMEDLNLYLKDVLTERPHTHVPSADTVLRGIEELATENISYTAEKTGNVYVYGLLAAKDGEKKAFQDLVAKTGLANGDKIMIHGQRGDYQGKIEVLNAYFVEIVEKGEDNPDPGPNPGGEGDGTEASPYNVAYVRSAGNPGTTAWVRGYIVGTVKDGSQSYDDAVFGTESASNTNILLADAADCSDASLCIPVQLPAGDVRDALSLKQHPENLGKAVFIYANLEKYFGQPGLKSASKYTWEGNGGDNPDPGSNPEDALFSADFTSGENGFTIYNVVIDENLDYVWAVDSKYGWKASAFKDNVRYATDSYIVSPAIDLTSASSATLTFSHVARYFGDSPTDLLSVLVSTSFEGDVEKASWVTLTVPTWPSGNDWNFVDSGDISLAGYVGTKVYIAFRYTSTTTTAPTWEIKSLTIK
ncbi:MAG: choice-of-anchor J domain-containing protein [Bacteroidaceae bacterium]|nr:choice-of-anchor J domain-containing protein [Bacteroidaceae bacterium]